MLTTNILLAEKYDYLSEKLCECAELFYNGCCRLSI